MRRKVYEAKDCKAGDIVHGVSRMGKTWIMSGEMYRLQTYCKSSGRWLCLNVLGEKKIYHGANNCIKMKEEEFRVSDFR